MSDMEYSQVPFELHDDYNKIYPPEEHGLIVAIDFGTSNSAAAYAHKGQSEIHPVIEEGGNQAKSTTTVTLMNTPPYEGVAFGTDALNTFDKNHHLLFHRFKMKLHSNTSTDTDTLSPDAGVNVEVDTQTVIARAIELLAKRAVAQIMRDEEGFSDLEFQHLYEIDEISWVITLPAIWTESAKLMMRQAAVKAGMIDDVTSCRLIIGLEPECAAISIDDVLETPGGRYLILDCGGGTIDTAAFEVYRDDQDVVRLKSLIAPSGNDFGSTRIDKKFLAFINELFQSRIAQDDATMYEFMSQTWEKAKHTYGSYDVDSRPKHININIVTLLHAYQDLNIHQLVDAYNQNHHDTQVELKGATKLKIPAAIINECFEAPLKNIKDHVFNLLRQVENLDKVILVGGFSASTMIQESVERICEENGVILLISQQPSLGIVLGAVRFGLNPAMITSRIIKSTLGVSISLSLNTFQTQYPDFDIDSDPHKYRSKGGHYRVNNCFSIFFRPGDEVKINQPVEKTYYPVHDDQQRVNFKVAQSSKPDTIFIDEPDCKKMASVTVNAGNAGPARERPILVRMYFSLTELVAIFTVPGTQDIQRAQLSFEEGSSLIESFD